MAITLSDQEVMEAIRKLQVAYRLKRVPRYGTVRDPNVHSESVAEHVYALIFLAHYFLPLEDPDHALDWNKVYDMLLFHDFGEIRDGDIPYHLKTVEHEERERDAAKEIFASLPSSMGNPGYAIWKEYEEQTSPEARFSYALDKVEPVFELMDPVSEQSLTRMHFTYEHHIHKKIKATEGFPILRRFVEVGSTDMLSRNVFWSEESSKES